MSLKSTIYINAWNKIKELALTDTSTCKESLADDIKKLDEIELGIKPV